jgi:hypothetical protein
VALSIFHVTGLLTNEYDARLFRPFAKDGLCCVFNKSQPLHVRAALRKVLSVRRAGRKFSAEVGGRRIIEAALRF